MPTIGVHLGMMYFIFYMDYGFISALLTPFFTESMLKWFCSTAYLAMVPYVPISPWLLGFLSAPGLAALKVSDSDESVAMPRFLRWGQGCAQNGGY